MPTAIRLNDVYPYTEQLCANVHEAFADADKATKATLGAMQRDLQSAASALLRARSVVAASRTRLTRSAEATSAPLEEAGAMLRGLRHHLSGLLHLKQWDGSVAAFFGGATAVPRAHLRVVAALRTAVASLTADPTVTDRAAWLKRLEKPHAELSAAVQETSRLFDRLRDDTTALARRREEWRVHYDAVLKVARGHLLIAGRDAEAATFDPFAQAVARDAAVKRGRAKAARRRAAQKAATAVDLAKPADETSR